MSSPSLSDSTGTFKVDCNVAGTFLENRPKFKFLQNSSDFFFFFHLSSISTIIFLTRTSLKLAFISFPCSWVKDHKGIFKKKRGQRTKWQTKSCSSCNHSMDLWFDIILIYVHVIIMNIVTLTTQ